MDRRCSSAVGLGTIRGNCNRSILNRTGSHRAASVVGTEVNRDGLMSISMGLCKGEEEEEEEEEESEEGARDIVQLV